MCQTLANGHVHLDTTFVQLSVVSVRGIHGGTKHDASSKFKEDKNPVSTNKYTKFSQLTITKSLT